MTNHEKIKLAFNDIKAPKGFANIVLQNAENNTETRTQTRGRTRLVRRLLIAAIVAVTFTTTALAATGTIDIPSIFYSIFGNEQAKPFIITSDDIIIHKNVVEETPDLETGLMVNEGFEVKVISAFYDTDKFGVYLELEITDPTGEGLSDSFMLFIYDDERGYIPLNMSSFEPSEVEFINENTVRAGFYMFTNTDTHGEIKIDLIISDVSYETEHNTGNKVMEHIGIENPIILPNMEFVQLDEIIYDGTHLTVLYRDSDIAVHGWGFVTLGLLKTDGDIIWPSDKRNRTIDFSEVEVTYDISSISDPDDLTFVWSGIRAKHPIKGNWEFTIAGETGLEQKIFSAEIEGLRTEFLINSLKVTVNIYDAPDMKTARDIVFSHQDFEFILHLADGSTVEPIAGGSEGGTDIIAISYYMDFINPTNVTHITFRGVEIND